MNKYYEPTQKSNPNKLTVNQHVFPKAAISRFSDSRGLVEVYSFRLNKKLSIPPSSQMFCAQRVWDQRGEYFQKDLEDCFQSIVQLVLSEGLRTFDNEQNAAISEFFLLWRFRQLARANPLPDIKLNALGPARHLSKDEHEKMEMARVLTFRSDGTLPSRSITSIQIQRAIDHNIYALRGRKWGVLESRCREFLVPDAFLDTAVIPISPRFALSLDSESSLVGDDVVAKANLAALSECTEYVFSSRLAGCAYGDQWQTRLFTPSKFSDLAELYWSLRI